MKATLKTAFTAGKANFTTEQHCNMPATSKEECTTARVTFMTSTQARWFTPENAKTAFMTEKEAFMTLQLQLLSIPANFQTENAKVKAPPTTNLAPNFSQGTSALTALITLLTLGNPLMMLLLNSVKKPTKPKQTAK